MRAALLVVILALLSSPVRGEEPPANCVDVAVVGRLVGETPLPLGDVAPDEIIVYAPWLVEFEVEQVVLGRLNQSRVSATAYLHTSLGRRHRADHYLLLLQRRPDREFDLVDFDARVLRDREGQFIIPFAHRVERDDLEWLPESYERYLSLISYRASDAWWLDGAYAEDLAPSDWHVRRGRRVIALRGLYLSDLDAMLASVPGAICRPG